LGARLRAARKARGLTQEALAGPEFTKSYVSAVERE
jgi:transcriptional regulator with XRE-family HTH domain